VAGCLSPAQKSNPVQTSSTLHQGPPPVTQSQTPVQTAQAQCPVVNNTTPFITLNPVGDHYLEEVIEINGTTNCNTGEIHVVILSSNFKPCPKNSGIKDSPAPCTSGVEINAPIIQGPCGINTWSVEVNTSEHHFYPDEFVIDLYDLDCASYQDLYGFFTLKPSPESATRS